MMGCVLTTDPDSLSEGCPEGQKHCDGQCVFTSDEEYGCARAGCSPCGLPNATSQCNPEGQCAVSSCIGAFSDCDGNANNGCEVNLDTDPDNCGKCARVCEDPEDGEAACGKANCYIRRCDLPFLDCNFDYGDGCEVDGSQGVVDCQSCPALCVSIP